MSPQQMQKQKMIKTQHTLMKSVSELSMQSMSTHILTHKTLCNTAHSIVNTEELSQEGSRLVLDMALES